MADLQERLERAIELSPFETKTAFHKAFASLAEERGLAGRSNPVFYRHLSGMGRPPSTDWLRVFADIARVRWEWLAANDGPPTEAEATAAAVSEGGDIITAYYAAAPYSVGLLQPIGQTFGNLLSSFRAHREGSEPVESKPERVGQLIGILEQLALEPLRAFTPDDGELCDRFSDYMNLMYAAFNLAMPAAGKGYSEAEFVEANRHRLDADYPEWLEKGTVFLVDDADASGSED